MKSLLILFIIFFIVDLYSFNRYETISLFELKGKEWKIYKIEGLSLKKDLNGRHYIGLSENFDSKENELFLDFENQVFLNEKYKNLYTSFIINKSEKFSGNSSGKFTFRDNLIKLLPLDGSIFYPGNEVGSFTIDFWLYPYKSYDRQYIVYYIGENLVDLESGRYGFSIFIENGMIKYKFENFFYDSFKRKSIENIELIEENPLNLYRWEHHAIAFDSKKGKLAIFRNGVEEKVIWTTSDFKRYGSIFYPYVNKNISSPIIIGKNSFFSLDNLRFKNEFFTNFSLSPLNRKKSYLITEVINLSDNMFRLKDIKLDLKPDLYSFVKVGYRISDEVFSPYDTKIPWVYINPEKLNLPVLFRNGRYIQLKLTVYPELADEDFKIYSITLKYSIDENPYRPHIVKVVPGDGEVEVFWVPSPEDDVAGYEIYYGNESKNYICSDAKEGTSPVFVKKQKEGLEIHKAKLSLINEKPYFISIRAIDINGHKSDYSEEIYIRPSSVYNPNGYSIDR